MWRKIIYARGNNFILQPYRECVYAYSIYKTIRKWECIYNIIYIMKIWGEILHIYNGNNYIAILL